jgi:putative phosphonate metabolism protein
MSAARYAIYYAPEPGSALASLGATWLGYDVASGTAVNQPDLPAVTPEQLRAITEEPRRYGFHATLKPPFVLAEGRDAALLDAAVAVLAAGFPAFVTPPLRLVRISGFWALTLSEPCAMLDRLAERCVAELDAFRAPPSDAELARRRRARLTPRHEALLERWGYPYVMEEYRFHMTLTGRLDSEEGEAMGRVLAPFVAPCCASPLAIDAISLFRQDGPDVAFRLVHRYELIG